MIARAKSGLLTLMLHKMRMPPHPSSLSPIVAPASLAPERGEGTAAAGRVFRTHWLGKLRPGYGQETADHSPYVSGPCRDIVSTIFPNCRPCSIRAKASAAGSSGNVALTTGRRRCKFTKFNMASKSWRLPTLGWLAAAAFGLMVGSFILIAQFSGAPPGSTYVPAHMENGKFVPGAMRR